MSFFGFFKTVYTKVSDAFVRVVGKDAAQKFADGAIVLLKTELGVIAVDAVRVVQSANPLATPADKRAAAFAQITADAKTRGIVVGSSLVNMLIELAVQAITQGAFFAL